MRPCKWMTQRHGERDQYLGVSPDWSYPLHSCSWRGQRTRDSWPERRQRTKVTIHLLTSGILCLVKLLVRQVWCIGWWPLLQPGADIRKEMSKESKKRGGNDKKAGRFYHKLLCQWGLEADLFRTTHFMTLGTCDTKFDHLGRTLQKKRSP